MFVEVSTRLEYRLIYFPIFTVLKTDKIMTKAAIVNIPKNGNRQKRSTSDSGRTHGEC